MNGINGMNGRHSGRASDRADSDKEGNYMGKIKQLLGINLAVFLIFALLKPERFLTAYNFESMCFQFPEAGLLTLGIGITMLTAGADLSIVAVANLTATVNGIILLQYMPAGLTGSGVWSWLLLCLAFAAVIGLVCGVINGLLVAKLGIFPILATLGTQNSVYRDMHGAYKRTGGIRCLSGTGHVYWKRQIIRAGAHAADYFPGRFGGGVSDYPQNAAWAENPVIWF